MDSLSSFADPPRAAQPRRLKQQASTSPKIPGLMLPSLSMQAYKPDAADLTKALGECPIPDPKRMEAQRAGEPARS
jgi:hypothetical protein